MKGKNKHYSRYDHVIKPGWNADVDPEVKRGKKQDSALAPLYPQAEKHVYHDEVEQYADIFKDNLKFTKCESKSKTPSGRKRFLGKEYGQDSKSEDEDDIQHMVQKKKKQDDVNPYLKNTKGKQIWTNSTINSFRSGRGTEDQVYEIISSIQPFHSLLDDLGQMEDKPEDHVFPMPKLKCQDYLWTCQGKRRTGKTTTWKNVFPRFAHMYPYVYFFAQTRFANQFHGWAPYEAIHKGFSEGVLWKLLEVQEMKIEKNQRLYDYWSQYEDESLLVNIPNPYIYMLWDDTIGGRLVHDSEILNDVAYFGRHYRTSGWINTQHGHAIHPGFRANTDVAIGFQQAQWNQRETFRREYLSFMQKKSTFDTVYEEYTRNRQFIAVDLASIEKEWSERLYVGTPDPKVHDMKLGCSQYWQELS